MPSIDVPQRTRTRLIVAIATLPLIWLLPYLLTQLAEVAPIDIDIRPLATEFAVSAVWLLGVAMAVAQRPATQNVLLSLASLFLALAVSELVCRHLNAQAELPGVELIDNTEHQLDPDLGFRLQPDQRIQARETAGEKLISNVPSPVDATSYRSTPGTPLQAPCRAVFFGDSFTFGWGLSDDQTMPSHFVEASERRYRAYNLSTSGYGPHQMLR